MKLSEVGEGFGFRTRLTERAGVVTGAAMRHGHQEIVVQWADGHVRYLHPGILVDSMPARREEA